MQITSLTKTAPLNLLHQSPFTLHDGLLRLIKREANHASAGGAGHIIAKINALVEPEVIRALYEASMSGVHVDLVVRGMCCLRPGIPGLSENIRVRSIIGRFLEHSRCYFFHNNGDEEVYCASADWMDRSFFRRIEIMYPICDPAIKLRLVGDLDTYLADNTQAWELLPDGHYRLIEPEPGADLVSVQSTFLSQLAEST
jgi:polyphosphate kinase